MTSKKRLKVYLKYSLHCELLKLVSGNKPGYITLKAENSLSVIFGFIVAYTHKKINILVSVFNIIFFLFYDVNLNTQYFIYLEFVQNQLSLRRNMPVFAKCNERISASQLFYIQVFPNCLPISK